jgi:hypothetical protein
MKALPILLVATLVLPGVPSRAEDLPGYFVTASYCTAPLSCKPENIRLYPADLINSKDAATLNSAASALQTGDAALARQIQGVERNLKQQLADSLAKIPDTLFSDAVKAKMMDELSATIAAQNQVEQAQFKAELKREMMEAVRDALKAR